MSLLDMFSTLSGVTVIFKLGFIPNDDDLYELTPEQYEHYYATAEGADEHSDEKVYMLLPKDPQKYAEIASEDVFALGERDVVFIEKAAKLIEEYCAKSGKTFNSLDEKLRYCASVMPDVVSKGTQYERYHNKIINKVVG
jgi:formylmethanofuran dehydrogenase subunit E